MPNDVIDSLHALAEADKVSRGTIYSEVEDIFEPNMQSSEIAGVVLANAGVDESENEKKL